MKGRQLGSPASFKVILELRLGEGHDPNMFAAHSSCLLNCLTDASADQLRKA